MRDDGQIPLFEEGVAAGFPSPAQDAIDRTLDLNELCVRHPAATYFVRARGDSMLGAGIHDGDVLVVDRALDARDGDVVIAAFEGEFTVKRLDKSGGGVRLVPENPAYPAIEVRPGVECSLFGVVTSVVHFFRRTA